jgi:hypothetical protein
VFQRLRRDIAASFDARVDVEAPHAVVVVVALRFLASIQIQLKSNQIKSNQINQRDDDDDATRRRDERRATRAVDAMSRLRDPTRRRRASRRARVVEARCAASRGARLNFVVGSDIRMDSMTTDATTEARARARGESRTRDQPVDGGLTPTWWR